MSVPARPPQRIGDAERDHAAEQLREHLALGRLDQAEFDQRLDTAMQARYASDLNQLFTDLPRTDRSPAVAAPQSAAPARHGDRLSRGVEVFVESMSWVIWPLTIGLITWLDWGDFWWLIFVPIALSSAWQAWKRTGEEDTQAADEDD